jgi:hypothetical protein
MNEKKFKNLARILRIDQKKFRNLIEVLNEKAKRDLIEEIYNEKEELIKKVFLKIFNWYPKSVANEIFNVLFQKLRLDNFFFTQFFSRPDLRKKKDIENITFFLKEKLPIKQGFFLKWEKAEEFLKRFPPKNLLSFLGYSIDDLLKKEDIKEIMCVLRFSEKAEWLNSSFKEFAKSLKPEDFEIRNFEIIVIQEKFMDLARSFCEHKLHNVSHLKEYGVIFVIPTFLDLEGAILRLLILIFHYNFEIDFYSKLFNKYIKEPNFGEILSYLIEGRAIENIEEIKGKMPILVIPRYFFKDDEFDWRLYFPRINSEAYHYTRAFKALAEFSNNLGQDLSFWANLDWVGDYFMDENGIEVLISFNLADTVMSLVNLATDLRKFTYHQQEAVWNYLFKKAFNNEFDSILLDNTIKGYFDLTQATRD